MKTTTDESMKTMFAEFFKNRKVQTCMAILCAVIVASPAAIQHDESVIDENVNCAGLVDLKPVQFDEKKIVPAPVNETYYHVKDSFHWNKAGEISNLVCN